MVWTSYVPVPKSLKVGITGDQSGQDEEDWMGSGMEVAGGPLWSVGNVTRTKGHCGIFNHVRMMEKLGSRVWCLQDFKSSFSMLFGDPSKEAEVINGSPPTTI